jgi:hypothetical protein
MGLPEGEIFGFAVRVFIFLEDEEPEGLKGVEDLHSWGFGRTGQLRN